ncbi:hypothetical protein GCM10022198_24150 [Klugiella xanthotipulae]|uniref:Uncharacterized protein DUF3800 n=1 Tax=Klugiella xanthotipulae TaxID=244735 RepID=A0A543I697_9MICO|nr:DUF3800 domain-containing protein [Klugiella xanthotipulae]TQM66136.1 uncharacterized protein DUF3800 [Klugiella xanthotipulae]
MLFAFVDETGDRGVGPKSSEFFAMAAVVVHEEQRAELAQAIARIKTAFTIPPATPLHWVKHCKTYSRRHLVTRELAKVPGVCVNYVVFQKAGIPSKATILEDGVKFYNYVAGIMMERLLLTAECWPGGKQKIQVQFGHVKGFDHEVTLNYFRLKTRVPSGYADWALLERHPRFADMSLNSGLQAADQYAGILKVAICGDSYGGFEAVHLLSLRNQIRRAGDGRSWGYGFKVMGRVDFGALYDWWPEGGL